MANPNNTWKYRVPRERMESREINHINEDTVRSEMTKFWSKPNFEVRKVNRRVGNVRYTEMVAFRN